MSKNGKQNTKSKRDSSFFSSIVKHRSGENNNYSTTRKKLINPFHKEKKYTHFNRNFLHVSVSQVVFFFSFYTINISFGVHNKFPFYLFINDMNPSKNKTKTYIQETKSRIRKKNKKNLQRRFFESELLKTKQILSFFFLHFRRNKKKERKEKSSNTGFETH